MAKTIAEMAAERDPLYAAMQPQGAFDESLRCERWANRYSSRAEDADLAEAELFARDAALLTLAVRALRNQRQPYYDAR